MALVRSAVGRSSGLATPEKWVEQWINGGSVDDTAGVWVTEETALHYSPFFAAVNVIATDVGKLPLPLYERLDRGKRRAREHPLYRVLHEEPNDLMTPIAFKRTVQGHALTWGTGYAYIRRDGRGHVSELWPLRPDRVKPEPVADRSVPGRFGLTYRYDDPVNGIRTRLFPDEVLVIGGLGFDGIRGYSIVQVARHSLGLGMATERYGGALFRNGARPGGYLKSPKALSQPAQDRLRANWNNYHRGLDRAQTVGVLEEGLEWQSVGIPPEDAQFLETRKLQVEEAARWLRVPPHKLQHLEHATFSNIEHQGLEYITDTLLGWLITWEQGVDQRCLTSAEKGRYFAEHVVDALARADLKARYEAYAIGRNWGWLSADDVNELENRNPLPDSIGETYLQPLNMVPAIAAGTATPPERCPVHPGCTCDGRQH